MRTKKIHWEQAFPILVNKQLEKYKLTIDDIREVDDWYKKYTVTTKEYEEFIRWANEFLYNNITPKPTKKMVDITVKMFNFGYGLMIKDDE